jgi:2-haloacid dehalogenase
MCGMARAILSNGSRDMLEAAVHSAGIEKLLDAVLSVDDVSVFKPHSSVYAMVGQRFDAAPDEVLFVSSNGWDACSAAAFGFQTVWVNRDGAVPDRLHGRPDHVLADLAALPDLVSSL